MPVSIWIRENGFGLKKPQVGTGGAVKSGITYGETDDFGFNIVRDPVHIHDLHATMLHLLGIDHTKLTFPYQGRNFRLTDVHGKVIDDILP